MKISYRMMVVVAILVLIASTFVPGQGIYSKGSIMNASGSPEMQFDPCGAWAQMPVGTSLAAWIWAASSLWIIVLSMQNLRVAWWMVTLNLIAILALSTDMAREVVRCNTKTGMIVALVNVTLWISIDLQHLFIKPPIRVPTRA